MKRRRTLSIVGVAILLSLPFIVPLFSPWSHINCREFELDLASGQQRMTRYLYWIPVRSEIDDTPASLALGESTVAGAGPSWVRTSTFGPFTRHSPHYRYHSAYYQIRMLDLVWEEFGFGADGRRATAAELLRRLRIDGSDSPGSDYLNELRKSGEQGSGGDP
ncbi:hypothetical protein [Haloferula sp.]|uniref:hypothetical protein n=1 Tax=Haloferula sp. TaxID=2497595 RepID=UPI00329D4189